MVNVQGLRGSPDVDNGRTPANPFGETGVADPPVDATARPGSPSRLEMSATLQGDDTSPDRERDPGATQPPMVRGALVGRYITLSVLGAGAMGVVYAAYDPELERKVALKLVRPSALSIDYARLLREARTLARVAHPNVVSVFDVGTVGQAVFIAMELVEGKTVGAWMRLRERSIRELLELFMAAARGLAAAHRAGISHRDFKPDNVMVGSDGRVRVLDFGLARAGQPGHHRLAARSRRRRAGPRRRRPRHRGPEARPLHRRRRRPLVLSHHHLGRDRLLLRRTRRALPPAA